MKWLSSLALTPYKNFTSDSPLFGMSVYATSGGLLVVGSPVENAEQGSIKGGIHIFNLGSL